MYLKAFIFVLIVGIVLANTLTEAKRSHRSVDPTEQWMAWKKDYTGFADMGGISSDFRGFFDFARVFFDRLRDLISRIPGIGETGTGPHRPNPHRPNHGSDGH